MKTSNKIPLPSLPEGAPGKPKGSRYSQQFGVIVVLPDEIAQIKTYKQFVKGGFKCRVVNT